MQTTVRYFAVTTFALLVAACGNGEGKLVITTWGEEYIEQEIPASPGGEEPGFVDGFAVRYSKFLVAMSKVEIADRAGVVGAALDGQLVFDLHPVGPHIVTTFPALEAKHWDEVSIEVKPASAATAGNASAADVTLMNGAGYSVYVEGEIATSTQSVSFAWGFTTNTLYHECESAEGAVGVVVPNGGEAQVQLTIHGDHFFYDDLQSPDTKLRASAIFAADTSGDGQVSLEELAAIDLTTLPSGQYGTGGDGAVEQLGQFVTALSRTVVHFQGEGECSATKQ